MTTIDAIDAVDNRRFGISGIAAIHPSYYTSLAYSSSPVTSLFVAVSEGAHAHFPISSIDDLHLLHAWQYN